MMACTHHFSFVDQKLVELGERFDLLERSTGSAHVPAVSIGVPADATQCDHMRQLAF
jgi:hypothetical protein